MSEIAGAFASLATLPSITMILVGSAIGLLFGMLPGLGASQAMILLLPFTYGMDGELAIILFIAIMATATFGGSLPAILLNTPGTPANVVTTLDGYPMATQGEANKAIAISAAACAVGTIVGAIVLLSSIPVLQALISAFHAQERFWLIVFGLSTISLASKGNAVKGLAAGGVGVLISFIGRNYVFAGDRYTGGLTALYDGIPLAAFLVGVFAVAPMLVIGSRSTVVTDDTTDLQQQSAMEAIRSGFAEVYRYKVQTVRGSLVGVALGIIPAVGGAAAAFINYFISRQFARGPVPFGAGSAEGLIASESANDAKDGGTLMPTLSFGIPGDPNTAVLLGALLMHGVPLGFNLFENHRGILIQIVITLVVAQLVVSMLGLSVSRTVSRLTTVNTSYIVPLVFVFSMIGAFLYRGNGWDLVIVLLAALFAYGLTRNNYPPISLVLGYLLGEEAERTFMMSMRSDPVWHQALLDSWISWLLISLIVLTFLSSALLNRVRGGEDGERQQSGAGGTDGRRDRDDDGRGTEQSVESGGVAVETETQPASRYLRYEGVLFGGLLLLVAGAFALIALGYERDMSLFPTIVAIFVAVMLALVLGSHVSRPIARLVERLGGGLQQREEALLAANVEVTRKQLRIAIWLAASTALVLAFGFLTLPLVAVAYTRFEGHRPWRSTLVIGVVLLGVVGTMASMSGVRFWTGAVPTIISDFVGGGRLPL